MAMIVERLAPCRIEFCASKKQVPLHARFRFTQNHPYDIDVILELNGEEIDVTWKLGREMINHAAHNPRFKEGDGDVVVETFSSHFYVLLRPPGGDSAKLILNRIHVREFMDQVNQVMPWSDAVHAVFCQLDEQPDWLKEAD